MNTLSAILLAIPYPEIDPVLVQLGPFAIRWSRIFSAVR